MENLWIDQLFWYAFFQKKNQVLKMLARGQSNQCIQLSNVWINSYHLEAPWYGWIISLASCRISSMAGQCETRTAWDSPEFDGKVTILNGKTHYKPLYNRWLVRWTMFFFQFFHSVGNGKSSQLTKSYIFQRARRTTTNQLSVPCLQPDIKPWKINEDPMDFDDFSLGMDQYLYTF